MTNFNLIRRSRSEEGQSLSELALSVTVLFIMLAGLVDCGRLFAVYIEIKDAAQEGVNYAIYNPTDAAGISDRVRGASNQPVNLKDPAVTVNLQINTACNGNPAVVSVTAPFTVSAPFFGILTGAQNFPVSAVATGTILTPGCH